MMAAELPSTNTIFLKVMGSMKGRVACTHGLLDWWGIGARLPGALQHAGH